MAYDPSTQALMTKPIAIYVDADACPVKVGVADSSSKEFVRFFSYLF
jgi:hypothetical protein